MPKSSKRRFSSYGNGRAAVSPKVAQGRHPAPSERQSTLRATVGTILNRASGRARHPAKEAPADVSATENPKASGADENCPIPTAPHSLRRPASCASIDTVRKSNRTVRRRVARSRARASARRDSTSPTPVGKKNFTVSPSEITSAKHVQSSSPVSSNAHEKELETGEAISSQGSDDSQSDEEDAYHFIKELYKYKSKPSATVSIQPSGKLVGWTTTNPNDTRILPTRTDLESPPNDTEPNPVSEMLLTRSPSRCSDITADSDEDADDRLEAITSTKKAFLSIRPYEPDVVIWDAIQNTYYAFKCKLVLRCPGQDEFERFFDPGVQNIEFTCSTFPPRGHYAPRPSSMLYTMYTGATISRDDRRISVNAADGVHIDENWKTMKDDDGTWAWYVHVWTPIPMALFEKVDARLFRMVSRVWVRERNVAEAELVFSVSTLFRQLDMV